MTYEKYRRVRALPGMAPSGWPEWPVVGSPTLRGSSYTHLSATMDLMSLVQPMWAMGLHAGRGEGIQDCSTQCSASFCSACLTPTVSPHPSLLCCLWPWLGTCLLINRSSWCGGPACFGSVAHAKGELQLSYEGHLPV